jgi:hypothetical protein
MIKTNNILDSLLESKLEYSKDFVEILDSIDSASRPN